MVNKIHYLLVVLLLPLFLFSQNELKLKVEETKIDTYKINPLAPAKAAFYSAIIPGLGQAYNKRYWKIPLVYAAIGTGLYFYINNTKQYNRYRDAYKRRLAGYTDDEFSATLDTDRLVTGQRYFQQNSDLSLLITVGLYILNIVDASVDAHLQQFNVNENLSLKPNYFQDRITYSHNVAITLNYNFK